MDSTLWYITINIFNNIVNSYFLLSVTGKAELLPPTAEGTAEFLHFFDKLFDSVNSSQIHTETGKELRGAVTDKSPHIEYWKTAIKTLETIRFVKNGVPKIIPSLTNWITTIKGIEYLWNKLKSEFSFLCIRNFNQDPLENFFGSIRGHGVRNNNPTPQQFVHVYKSLIIYNFVSSHSPGSNCQMDDNDLLNNLTKFLEEVPEDHTSMDIEVACDLPKNSADESFKMEIENEVKGKVVETRKKNLYSYIGGSLARSILKTVNYCESCKSCLVAKKTCTHNSYIEAREYSKNLLLQPNATFRVIFENSMDIIGNNLTNIILKDNIKKYFACFLNGIDFSSLKCENHNMKDIFLEKFCNLYIYNYIKHVNAILKGKFTFNVYDKLTKMALSKYKVNKSKKLKIRKV